MINYDLRKIKAVIFDVDGVLSASTIPMDTMGVPLRTANIKDGYAIQLAQKKGLLTAIITGGDTPAVRRRYEALGMKDVYMGCAVKTEAYRHFVETHGLKDEEIIYVGDDIPDYEVMSRCGCPCCPADAASEIKEISLYVSTLRGGYGCGRDILEQVLKAQRKWLSDKEVFSW